MKLRAVGFNNHRKVFEVRSASRTLTFPYTKADPQPGSSDRVVRAYVDAELAREAFVYVLKSGREGTIHIDQVLEYNQDPTYMRDLLLYKLTLEAQKRIESSPVSKREIIRRLGTSAAQLYRLLDQTNYRKSMDHMLALLHVLDCDVSFVIRSRKGPGRAV